jgi:hypothetical protein
MPVGGVFGFFQSVEEVLTMSAVRNVPEAELYSGPRNSDQAIS